MASLKAPSTGARAAATLVAFSAYFVMSGMLAPIGIVSERVAQLLDMSITDATSLFSALTLALLFGSATAVFVLERFDLRRVMVLCSASIAVACLSFSVSEGVWQISGALGVIGFCCGLVLAGGALTITRLYQDRLRASLLVLTDSCFSVAGIVCSSLAVFFLGQFGWWFGAYLVVGAVAVLAVVMALVGYFPAEEGHVDQAQSEGVERVWAPQVWLCLVALFLYTLGLQTILLWLPNFAQTQLDASLQDAGQLVSQYWTGNLIGQLLVAVSVFKTGPRLFLYINAFTTAGFSIALWSVADVELLWWLALLWGVGNLGLLKLVITLATAHLTAPGGSLVSSLMLAGTIGTSVSAWVSSQVVEIYQPVGALQAGTLCLALMGALILGALLLSRAKPAPTL